MPWLKYYEKERERWRCLADRIIPNSDVQTALDYLCEQAEKEGLLPSRYDGKVAVPKISFKFVTIRKNVLGRYIPWKKDLCTYTYSPHIEFISGRPLTVRTLVHEWAHYLHDLRHLQTRFWPNQPVVGVTKYSRHYYPRGWKWHGKLHSKLVDWGMVILCEKLNIDHPHALPLFDKRDRI